MDMRTQTDMVYFLILSTVKSCNVIITEKHIFFSPPKAQELWKNTFITSQQRLHKNRQEHISDWKKTF